MMQLLSPEFWSISSMGLKKYLSNFMWVVGEQVLRIAAGIFLGAYIARWLGPSEFGSYSYAVAFVSILYGFARLGMDNILINYYIHQPDKFATWLSTGFWLRILGALICVFFSVLYFLSTADTDRSGFYILILTFGLIFQSFDVVDYFFQSKTQNRFISLCKVGQLIFTSTLRILIIHYDMGIMALVWVTMFDSIVLGLLIYLTYLWRYKNNFLGRFDIGVARILLKESWPLFIAGTLGAIYLRVDQIMVKQLLDDQSVGYFAAATKISVGFHFLPLVIANSIFPAVLNASKRSASLFWSRLRQFYLLQIAIAACIAIGISLFSKLIILTLYGSAFMPAIGPLKTLIWANIFVFIGFGNNRGMAAVNAQQSLIYLAAIGVFVNVALNYILVPKFGINGAAFATLLSFSSATVFGLFCTTKSRAYLRNLLMFDLLKSPTQS